MISQTLQMLLDCTAISSCALLLVLAIRTPLRRLAGAGLAYTAWLIVPLTLLAHLSSALLPVGGALSLPIAVTIPTLAIVAAREGGANQALFQFVCLLIWLAGIVAAAGLFARRQRRFTRDVGPLTLYSHSNHGAVRIRQAAQSTIGPLLQGLLRPVIVLPIDFEKRYTPQEQRLILAHELLHWRRGDLIANAFVTALQVLFWFNPLMHWSAGRMRLDQELACDASVLAQAGASAPHHAYASAILKTILADHHSPVACTWQSRHPVNERIMQFTIPAPTRAMRMAMQSLLAALTLAACYGASANSGSPGVPGVPGPGQYRIDILYTRHTVGANAQISAYRNSFSMVQDAGKRGVVKIDGDAAHACQFATTVTPMADDQVHLDMPVTCAGHTVHPKMVTQLGKLASFETIEGTAPEPQTVHHITFVVTR